MPPSFFAVGQSHLQILSEIFGHWASVDSDAPWKASLVCRLWHAAVLSTPEAWSRVDICFPVERLKRRTESDNTGSDSDGNSDSDSDDNCADEQRPRPWALWLSRARHSELSIHMKLGDPRVDLLYTATHLLHAHFSKIKELKLVNESIILHLDEVLDTLRRPAPALQHLSLNINKTLHFRMGLIGKEFTIVNGIWEFLKKAPRLRSLTLSNCLLGPKPVSLLGPQNHLALQTLTLNDTHIFELGPVLETIRSFMCLETLTFTSTVGCITAISTVVHPLILPTLTTLTVGDDIHILASLTLPKLQTLILDKELPKDGRKNLVTLLSNLFERGTNLRSLTISHALILNPKFRQILLHIPALVALELRHCSVELQPLIESTAGTDPLCPNLDTLRLFSSNLADGAALLELITARKQHPGRCRPITTLGIANCKYIDGRDVRKIQKAGGPALTIDYIEYAVV